MIWEGKNGEREDYTFGDLKRQTDRFANVLKSLGIETGDRVFTFMDRVPEQYIAVFGILKAGAIAGPLFSAFGPDPVRDRLQDSGAKVLITQPDLRRKISGIIPELFDLQHIIIVNKNGRDPAPIDAQDLDYYEEMGKASADFTTVADVPVRLLDHALHVWDHGQAQGRGPPPSGRGAAVRHRQVGARLPRRRHLLVHPPIRAGSPVRLYGMLAPWTNGVTQLIYEGGFRASAWYEQIQKHNGPSGTPLRPLLECS